MRRVLLASTAAIVVLLVIAGAVYQFGARRSLPSPGPAAATDHSAMAGMPTPTPVDAKPGDAATTPRGGVTIDPRRQQLIGVRTAPVTREPMQNALRTVGTVRYNETTLADINLRLEGWIRDLHVDYTG